MRASCDGWDEVLVDYLIQGPQKVINLGNGSANICPFACHAMNKCSKHSMGLALSNLG